MDPICKLVWATLNNEDQKWKVMVEKLNIELNQRIEILEKKIIYSFNQFDKSVFFFICVSLIGNAYEAPTNCLAMSTADAALEA